MSCCFYWSHIASVGLVASIGPVASVGLVASVFLVASVGLVAFLCLVASVGLVASVIGHLHLRNMSVTSLSVAR